MKTKEDIYEGSWKNEKRHGYGVFKVTDATEAKTGVWYMGWWKEDEKSGFGIQTDINNQYNSGIFYKNY